MPLLADSYQPPIWARNAHVNTVYPYFFKKVTWIWTSQQRINTPDGDFFDVSWYRAGQDKLIVLVHGLEGSSESQYILDAAQYFSKQDFDVVAINHRSCSGELNLTTRLYHNGFTQDLKQLLEQECGHYHEVFLLGYSLGGNISLNLVSRDLPQQVNIKAVAAVSVPVEMHHSALKLSKWYNLGYSKKFMETLIAKGLEKANQFPDAIDRAALMRCKNLIEFDDIFTAPLHGFRDAKDYYAQAASLPHLASINIPTLIINAQDDTFLSDLCYPTSLAAHSEWLHLMTTRYGGHVGFVDGKTPNWLEDTVFRFYIDAD